jgi:hypothetical protein
MILILLADGALGWTLRVLAPAGTAEGQSYRYQVLTPVKSMVNEPDDRPDALSECPTIWTKGADRKSQRLYGSKPSPDRASNSTVVQVFKLGRRK